jgi:hypothetical protein
MDNAIENKILKNFTIKNEGEVSILNATYDTIAFFRNGHEDSLQSLERLLHHLRIHLQP